MKELLTMVGPVHLSMEKNPLLYIHSAVCIPNAASKSGESVVIAPTVSFPAVHQLIICLLTSQFSPVTSSQFSLCTPSNCILYACVYIFNETVQDEFGAKDYTKLLDLKLDHTSRPIWVVRLTEQ